MRSKRVSVIFTLALFINSATAIGANAHAALVLSNPEVGSKVAVWPSSISLEFNEELISIGEEKSNFVVVNNADGDQVSRDDEEVIGRQIRVSLDPNTIEGPVLVFYRIISTDGHAVEGEYTFMYGEQAETAEGVQNIEKSNDPNYLYIALSAFITFFIFLGIYAYRRKKSN
jgi:methionine-rich copper-binding protein CopC